MRYKDNKIRLVYVAVEEFNKYVGGKGIGVTFSNSSCFFLPDGISFENAFKIISYLSEKVEKDNDIEPASQHSVAMVSHLLESYGFKKDENTKPGYNHSTREAKPIKKIAINCPNSEKIDECIDLITVGGDFSLFKKTNLFDRYFNWFSENVNAEEINRLYNKRR